MCGLIRKSAVLLSILTLLPLASASAERKDVPLILMDTGTFAFIPPGDPNATSADLEGTGVSTHLGKIVSTGLFEKEDRPSGGFKGKIQGTATAVLNETATATASPSPSPTASPTASPSPIPDTIRYRLSAEFSPDASGIFYGIGTYLITGGTGKFKRARGVGVFIGLADFEGATYNCFLRGTISY